jgi:hypothetical protein
MTSSIMIVADTIVDTRAAVCLRSVAGAMVFIKCILPPVDDRHNESWA